MTVTDPYCVASTALKTLIDTEFNAEGFKAAHDDLHEALGTDRVAIGISPIRQTPQPGNASVAQHTIKVQFYGLWSKEVDPTLAVNPHKITAYAARAAHAIETQTATHNNAVWYFTVTNVEYPRDPTGNKSRFELTVRATGDGPGLRETA